MADPTQDPHLQEQLAPLNKMIADFIAKTPVLAGLELDSLTLKKISAAPGNNKSMQGLEGFGIVNGGKRWLTCIDGHGEPYTKYGYSCP